MHVHVTCSCSSKKTEEDLTLLLEFSIVFCLYDLVGSKICGFTKIILAKIKTHAHLDWKRQVTLTQDIHMDYDVSEESIIL